MFNVVSFSQALDIQCFRYRYASHFCQVQSASLFSDRFEFWRETFKSGNFRECVVRRQPKILNPQLGWMMEAESERRCKVEVGMKSSSTHNHKPDQAEISS